MYEVMTLAPLLEFVARQISSIPPRVMTKAMSYYNSIVCACTTTRGSWPRVAAGRRLEPQEAEPHDSSFYLRYLSRSYSRVKRVPEHNVIAS